MSALRSSTVIVLGLALCGCHDHHEHHDPVVQPAAPRPVSIEIEVYDPVTGFVWENVGVRIVEADQEWSGTTVVSPYEDWYFTDSAGLVLLDEYLLAYAEVGFIENANRAALLGSQGFEDEALVILELDALGFTPLFVEVPLSWDVPDVFISVPFQ